jgi:hypothetical protein
MPLTPIEILMLVATVFGCWYALTRSGAVPRQIWRAPAAAFGVGILTLGMTGTTLHLMTSLQELLGASKMARLASFDAMLEYAYRPLGLSVLGTAAFLVILRSASQGDVAGTPPVGNVLSWLMVFCGFGCLVGVTGYHLAIMFEYELALLIEWTRFTFYLEAITLLMCVTSGLWALLQGADWANEATS